MQSSLESKAGSCHGIGLSWDSPVLGTSPKRLEVLHGSDLVVERQTENLSCSAMNFRGIAI